MKSLKYPLIKNEDGFTLLESLISLIIATIVLLLLTAMLSEMTQINQLIIKDAQTIPSTSKKIIVSRQIEWHLFLAQLENYLEGTELLSEELNKISVSEKVDGKKQTVQYGQAYSGNQNVYRRNNNGYNELLTSIETFTMTVAGDCLHLSVKFQNGEAYQGRIWIDGWTEKN